MPARVAFAGTRWCSLLLVSEARHSAHPERGPRRMNSESTRHLKQLGLQSHVNISSAEMISLKFDSSCQVWIPSGKAGRRSRTCFFQHFRIVLVSFQLCRWRHASLIMCDPWCLILNWTGHISGHVYNCSWQALSMAYGRNAMYDTHQHHCR